MHKHLRLTCYALLCLLVPIGVMAQTEHTYLDRALPGSWSEEGSDFQQTLPVEDNWWRNFKDPLLDSLIEVAVKQNYSVQMAMDRIAMAKANLRSAQGSYSPTLGLSAGWTRQQSSGNINQVPKAITQYSSATVDMNWEVDVFGSTRLAVRRSDLIGLVQCTVGLPRNSLERGIQRRHGLPLRPSSLLLHQYEGTATRGKGSATELPLPTDGRTDHPETV